MNKTVRKAQMNACLRKALKEYHAAADISQEKLAEKLDITPRACSALENGESGFSALSAFLLLGLLPIQERVELLAKLCKIIACPSQEAA